LGRLYLPSLPIVLTNLGLIIMGHGLGRNTGASRIQGEVRGEQRGLVGEEHPDTLAAMYDEILD
jgi:hypothetical protein